MLTQQRVHALAGAVGIDFFDGSGRQAGGEFFGVKDKGRSFKACEFPQLFHGERRLDVAAPANDVHALNAAAKGRQNEKGNKV